jgi:hypothetical protein
VIVIRIVGVLALITVGASLLAFLFTRNRRYLKFGWQVFRFSFVVVLVLLLLLVIERL